MNRDNTWNLFSTTTSHGKGLVDGIVKKVVSREVMSGRASVDLSQEFATVVTDNCKETKILHISQEEIKATKVRGTVPSGFMRSHTYNKFKEYTDHEKSKLLVVVQKHASALAILNTFMNKNVQESDDQI